MNKHKSRYFKSQGSNNSLDVLLLSMPFGPLFLPSIGLSLLKSSLEETGVRCEITYYTAKFAKLLGSSFYESISKGRPATCDLTGEWIFNVGLFEVNPEQSQQYVDEVLKGQSIHHTINKPVSEKFIQSVLEARGKVNDFLDECAEEVIERGPKVVGFTSVFEQQVASLGLAKRIKDHSPETKIIFGGANCEGVMGKEVVRQFPFVDVVVSGEAEGVFSKLVSHLLEGEEVSFLKNVYTRVEPEKGIHEQENSQMNINSPDNTMVIMDDLPIPDYDDFFHQLNERKIEGREAAKILFETSRGCWWGEKNHCVFCGLNGQSMTFRSKSAKRALDELNLLHKKYPNVAVSVVDNILDMKYFGNFLPQLAAEGLELDLFYEIKANLKKDQVRQMREAGITSVQPGIESLSNQVLELMRKGVKGIQNIQLLKWCKEFGVEPFWNILWGFPGELPAEYEYMTNLVPLLSHLKPPSGVTSIRLDRFSPNFDYAEQIGFKDVRPYPSYHYVYPIGEDAVKNLAYYFSYGYRDPRDVKAYTAPLQDEIKAWKENYQTSDLFSVDKTDRLLIFDFRPIAKAKVTVLSGEQKFLYEQCDSAQNMRNLVKSISQQFGCEYNEHDVLHILDSVLAQGLMIQDGQLLLSLAIPLGVYSPNVKILEQVLEVKAAPLSNKNSHVATD